MAKKNQYDYSTLSAEERLSIIEQRIDVLEDNRAEIRGLEVQLQQAEVDQQLGQPGADDRAANIKEQITAHRNLADERRQKVAELREAVAAEAERERNGK